MTVWLASARRYPWGRKHVGRACRGGSLSRSHLISGASDRAKLATGEKFMRNRRSVNRRAERGNRCCNVSEPNSSGTWRTASAETPGRRIGEWPARPQRPDPTPREALLPEVFHRSGVIHFAADATARTEAQSWGARFSTSARSDVHRALVALPRRLVLLAAAGAPLMRMPRDRP